MKNTVTIFSSIAAIAALTFNCALANSVKHTNITVRKLPSHKYSRTIGVSAVNRANRQALRLPKSTSYVDSIMSFSYMPGALYKIYCAPLSVTDLQFQPGENIISVAAGDTYRWEVSKTYSGSSSDKMEHLLIKPTESNLTNSLVVTTNLRTYHLSLHSTYHTYMAVVTWHYPSSHSFVKRYRSLTSKNRLDGLRLANLNFNYKLTMTKGNKPPNWSPIEVFNDGQKTYIQFPKNMQIAPTLFLGDKENVKAANYRVKGNYYIIDSVVYQAQLCLGEKNSPIIQITYNGN
ncbi:MAG: P-type conjugative transfer protein TrbG [Gammaproteobacteria bacterium]|jgi:type IV secretion system protein VirB9